MINDSQHDIVQSNEIIELLENEEARVFLNEHINERPENVALTYSGKVKFNLTKLTQILHLYQKAQDKLPNWVNKRCAFHSKSYAQSSHWKVAQYKSTLFSGDTLLDLTSGLGVDDYFFSKVFNQVIAVEKDSVTHQFAAYNQKKLNTPNIQFIEADLHTYQFKEIYDVIYLDPDRRVNDDRILGDFENYSPNILEGHSKWLAHSKCLLIKLSPMVDLALLERTFPSLKCIYTIGYKNEVKEVLIELSNDRVPFITRTAVNIYPDYIHKYENTLEALTSETNSEGVILLEPSKPLIKSGLSQQYCKDKGLKPIKPSGLYYLSNQIVENFDGRQFKIIEQIDPSLKQVKKHLKSNQIGAIDIAQRHYFEDVRTIRTQLKIKEGGSSTLHFTTNAEGKPLCFRSERIKAT